MRHYLRSLGSRRSRKWCSALFILALLAAAAAGAHDRRRPIRIQILDISDWHAQLDPLFVFGEGTFGGAAELSAYWQMDRATHPNTLTLAAGDAFGASPPLSSFFNEEPAVRSMNLMGFDVDTFGNHNFDRGVAHLQQMIDLAEFQYVSANLKNVRDNLRGVKRFKIFRFGGRGRRDRDDNSSDDDSSSDDSSSVDDDRSVKVAVIGITNPEAPTLVFPGRFGTIEVTDPVRAARRARRAAMRKGAQVFVAITHLGVTGFDADGNAFGPLIDFAENLRGFHVIFGDHTGFEFSGFINGALVVENRSKGRTYARVHLTVRPTRNKRVRVTDRSVEFVDPFSDGVVPDPAIEALLQPFRDQLSTLLGGVIGESNVLIPRGDSCGQSAGRSCESLVGDVTTDAMRTRYGVDFAITNSGGLRADLTCPARGSVVCPVSTPPPFPITAGQVLTVLPFGNVVVTLDVNGAELKTMLENGVSTSLPGVSGRFAQVSGLCFTYDTHAAPGSRIIGAVRQAPDGSCTGAMVDLTAGTTYSIAENDFMANGGDGYPVFSSRAVSRDFMDQVVADYIAANTPIAPTIEGRIECTSTGVTLCPITVP